MTEKCVSLSVISCDALFDSRDIVAALQSGMYNTGAYAGSTPRAFTTSEPITVPEPTASLLMALGALSLIARHLRVPYVFRRARNGL